LAPPQTILARSEAIVSSVRMPPSAQGGEQVDRLLEDRLGVDARGAKGAPGPRDAHRVEIAHDQLRAGALKIAAKGEADGAEALDAHPQAGELLAPEDVAHGGADRHQHPVGGDRERLLGARRRRRGVGGLGAHQGEIGERDADVVGDDVAPAQAVDGAAHGAQQGGRLGVLGIADDHRLAAAPGQPADRRLAGHPGREAQHVGERIRLPRIGSHAAAAEGRPERGG
jgi:hypothetical protein